MRLGKESPSPGLSCLCWWTRGLPRLFSLIHLISRCKGVGPCPALTRTSCVYFPREISFLSVGRQLSSPSGREQGLLLVFPEGSCFTAQLQTSWGAANTPGLAACDQRVRAPALPLVRLHPCTVFSEDKPCKGWKPATPQAGSGLGEQGDQQVLHMEDAGGGAQAGPGRASGQEEELPLPAEGVQGQLLLQLCCAQGIAHVLWGREVATQEGSSARSCAEGCQEPPPATAVLAGILCRQGCFGNVFPSGNFACSCLGGLQKFVSQDAGNSSHAS